VVGLQLKARYHSRHGVDLAAQLRHEEAAHHTRRGQLEADGRAEGNGQMIDAGDAFWADEQPLPVERDDLNFHGLHHGGNRRAWIEVV
jgi:hypothetical protein